MEDAQSRTVTWEVLSGTEADQIGTVPYQAFEIRQGITLLLTQPLEHESVTLIIDDNRGAATGFLARSSAENPEQLVSLRRLEGPILEADPSRPARFESADDLAGTRLTLVYPNEVAIYEQIYLNEHYMTWVAHKGTSAGVADTERYEAIKIAPLVYLVAWNEKSAPLQISMLLDFGQMRERASMFGVDLSQDRTVYQTATAEITEIAHTAIGGLKVNQ